MTDTPAPPEGSPGPPPGTELVTRPGIVVRDVHRAFGSVQALDGVTFSARSGAVTALVGPNGSGKTTLLLVLAGLLVPDAGEVRVGGHDPVTDGPAARAATGWMPDAFGTWDSLTAREVLHTFAAAYRIDAATARTRAAELLATVHLSEYADRPASVLSRGQKQRLGLARALVHDPQVLLLDEPASGLDPRSRVDLRVLLRRLADEGRTVIVSSHILSELEEMSDDVVFVSRGRTVTSDELGTGTVRGVAGASGTWHVRALSYAALVSWLTSVGASWRPDDEQDPHQPPREQPGGVLLTVDGDDGAAKLVRDAVAAGVPLVSLAPAAGALERAYLALEEERR
ncbi:ABC transporter ATP-binding protein [Cellulomonas palmilytica]|uniref:ABC transporter ATP-binding protein n=1 Tax=Cellulomonas palmilytica TaxID=2608402 RepID=UPI001F247321|nr:ABC transporter ATP-binding protein [Cellulomonas palmilytica]UJP40176.1 ABC transporter ATP-binding protein [Cellulomonas palmilytica]